MSSSASDCVRIMRAVLNVTLDWTDALVIATKLAHCGVSPVSATAAIYLLPTMWKSGIRSQQRAPRFTSMCRTCPQTGGQRVRCASQPRCCSPVSGTHGRLKGSAEQCQAGEYAANGKRRFVCSDTVWCQSRSSANTHARAGTHGHDCSAVLQFEEVWWEQLGLSCPRWYYAGVYV